MLLLGALGAAADGAAGVRPPVPLVRRARGGRSGVGREQLLEEPRPAARGRGGAALPGGAAGAAGGEAAAVERAFLGGRDADPGLGQPEELPAQGWRRRAAGAGAQRGAGLQGREALERDPCQHHRPGRAALPQGRRRAGEALLHRARADGEPQRADGRGRGDAGDRRRRAAGGDRAGQGRGRGGDGSPSAPTRPTTPRTSSLECREAGVTPHVAQAITSTRGSRIDGRTTRHPGYAVSLRLRKRIEESFGWTKEVAGLAQVKLRGLARVDFAFVLGLAAYNLVRLPKLLAGASP